MNVRTKLRSQRLFTTCIAGVSGDSIIFVYVDGAWIETNRSDNT